MLRLALELPFERVVLGLKQLGGPRRQLRGALDRAIQLERPGKRLVQGLVYDVLLLLDDDAHLLYLRLQLPVLVYQLRSHIHLLTATRLNLIQLLLELNNLPLHIRSQLVSRLVLLIHRKTLYELVYFS